MNHISQIDHDGRKEYAPAFDTESTVDVFVCSASEVVWMYENARPTDTDTAKVMETIEKLERAMGIDRGKL